MLRRILLKSGSQRLKNSLKPPVRFYVILKDEIEPDYRRVLIESLLFVRFIRAERIKNMFYFYIDYQTYIDQCTRDENNKYLEPYTGIQGEIDTEYFEIEIGKYAEFF